MSDVFLTRSDKASRAGRKPEGVTTRRVRTPEGDKVAIRSIDANSPAFGEDFLYVFTKNVEAERRENKRRFGSADGLEP